jgi:predicted RNA-binding Zn-ribbon protein involved in translation (DUF1610 family)
MVKFPDSMDELVYFTRRSLGEKGKAVAWVRKQKCPKCGKSLMGKPKDKTGKVLIRAKEYSCPSCGYTAEKKEYEESLTAEVQYTCPACGSSGEAEAPFKRKKIEGVDTLRVKCGKCSGNIDITKKMKEKGGSGDDDGDE